MARSRWRRWTGMPEHGTGPQDATEEYGRLRDEVATTETPRAALRVAVLVCGLSLLNFLAATDWYPYFHLMDVGVAAVTLVFGMWASRSTRAPSAVRWGFAACLALLALNLLAQTLIAPVLGLGYVLVTICLIGPLVMDWPAFGGAAAVVVVASGVVAAEVPDGDIVGWVLLSVTAALASAVMLQLRLRSLQAQAGALAQAHETATRDPLTGVLNRRGLEEQLPGFRANAARMHQHLCVQFVDVDGLKQANDAWGHARGDELIRRVAQALSVTVRQGDLIARWGGDEFVVASLGGEPAAEEFRRRLTEHLTTDGLDVLPGVGSVSVGTAVGDPQVCSTLELIEQADQDMYRRRAQLRDGSARGEASERANDPDVSRMS